MQDSDNLPSVSITSGETLLLWVAVGLAVVFLGLLAIDFFKRRRKSHRRRRNEPKSLREKLLTPVHRAQALRNDLEQILNKRSHRKDRYRRPPPEPPP
jgi:beta-lactamase regulating signal transducer with metallopeptidase domain